MKVYVSALVFAIAAIAYILATFFLIGRFPFGGYSLFLVWIALPPLYWLYDRFKCPDCGHPIFRYYEWSRWPWMWPRKTCPKCGLDLSDGDPRL